MLKELQQMRPNIYSESQWTWGRKMKCTYIERSFGNVKIWFSFKMTKNVLTGAPHLRLPLEVLSGTSIRRFNYNVFYCFQSECFLNVPDRPSFVPYFFTCYYFVP